MPDVVFRDLTEEQIDYIDHLIGDARLHNHLAILKLDADKALSEEKRAAKALWHERKMEKFDQIVDSLVVLGRTDD